MTPPPLARRDTTREHRDRRSVSSAPDEQQPEVALGQHSDTAGLAKWQRDAVRRMVAARRATLTLVRRLPERDMLRPRTLDRWSVKDVLGHLLACDEETVRRFRLIAGGDGDRLHWVRSTAAARPLHPRAVARPGRVGLRCPPGPAGRGPAAL